MHLHAEQTLTPQSALIKGRNFPDCVFICSAVLMAAIGSEYECRSGCETYRILGVSSVLPSFLVKYQRVCSAQCLSRCSPAVCNVILYSFTQLVSALSQQTCALTLVLPSHTCSIKVMLLSHALHCRAADLDLGPNQTASRSQALRLR